MLRHEAARAGDDVLDAAAPDGERQSIAVGAEHACARADLVDRPQLRRLQLGEQVDDLPPRGDVFCAHAGEDARGRPQLGSFTEPLRDEGLRFL